MAKVERKPQRTSAKGAVPTVLSGLSAADTQIIPNKGGDVLLRVINGGSEPTNVTVATPGEVDGNAIADLVVAVAAGVTKDIGPLDPAVYNDEEGNLEVTFSKVATLTLEVKRVSL
jgi:hypothetical protein